MKKIMPVLMLLMFCAVSFAQNKPPIAVYVTSGNTMEEDRVLSTIMSTAIAQMNIFELIERGDAFLDEVAREHYKQRDGSVDDAQIRTIGRQFGVQFVCVGQIAFAFGGAQISARVIDVETGAVLGVDNASLTTISIKSITDGLNNVVRSMTPQIVRSLSRM